MRLSINVESPTQGQRTALARMVETESLDANITACNLTDAWIYVSVRNGKNSWDGILDRTGTMRDINITGEIDA